jgi:myo-inositol 2-dehydrogenase/D-chiro-inositol 1-dehydrogenase
MLNRRYCFLGALAAPVITPPVLRAQNSRVGYAVIGVGNRGTGTLRGGIMQVEGLRVAALCDLKADRLDRAASMASRDNPFTTRDWKEVLTRPDVDAVHISTPCNLHVEMAIAALRAGKHVYCEKPVGITPSSIAELVQVARSTDRIIQVGQQLRSSKRFAETIQRIHDGVAGKVVMINAKRHSGDDLSHDGSSAEWFFDVTRSGDVLVEMSVHNLDLCNWIAQDRPESASGFGGTMIWQNDPPGRTNMDGYTLSYEYRNGIKLSYTQVFFHPNGMPNGGQVWSVLGTTGGVDVGTSVYYPRAKGSSPQPLVPEGKENLDQLHVGAFIEGIKTGKQPNANLQVGVNGAMTAILGREAIYRKSLLRWSDLGVLL